MTCGSVVTAGGAKRSMDELRVEAARIANALQARELKTRRIALLLHNSVNFITASEATRMAGCVPVPINWHLTPEEIAHVLDDCAPDVVFGHADFLRDLGPETLSKLTGNQLVVWLPTPDEIGGLRATPAENAAPPEGATTWAELAGFATDASSVETAAPFPLIYTSGTTGHPKGVLRLGPPPNVPDQGIDTFFWPGVRTFLAAPLYHAAPNRFAQRTLHSNGTLVLAASFDAEECLAVIEHWRIETTFLVPTMIKRILDLPPATLRKYDTSSLRHAVTAGAPCPPELKSRLIELWGPVVYEFYGCTETGALTHCTSEDARSRPGTVGRALPNARLAILDAEGRHCPAGVSGEIFGVRTDYPEFTYLNRPGDRNDVMREGMITGGDVGYLDDEGYLFVNDRKRDMIISGGVNIYPARIEAVLMEHSGVRDCAAFGIPDADLGETVAVAYETAPDNPAGEDELRGFLARRLAKHMTPRLYVPTDALPRDPTGKLQKRRLKAPYWKDQRRPI